MIHKYMTLRKVLPFVLLTALLFSNAHAATSSMLWGKKSKKNQTETAPPPSRYKTLTGRGAG